MKVLPILIVTQMVRKNSLIIISRMDKKLLHDYIFPIKIWTQTLMVFNSI